MSLSRRWWWVLAVIGHQDITDFLQRTFGASRARGRIILGGRALSAQTASRLVEIILVAILGVLLGLIFLSFFAPVQLPENNVVAAAPAEQQYGVVSIKSPFLTTTLAPAAISEAPVVADTTLDLTLTGVWTNPEGGSATIRIPDGSEKRFAVGELVVQGVNLAAVYGDHVTLDRGGVHEALRFETKTRSESEPPRQSPTSSQSLDLAPAAMGRLASVLTLAPAMDVNGNFAIEVHAGRDRRTFAALGLQNGDRIISINGTPAPNNPAALGNLLREMQQGNAARIIVERGGVEKPIVFSTDKLGFD